MRRSASGKAPSEGGPPRLVALIRSHPTLSLVIIAALGAGLYAAYSALHRSESRELSAICRSVAHAVAEGDAAQVMAHVSPFFFEAGMDRRDVERAVRHALRERPLSRVVVVVRQVQVNGPRASVLLLVDSTRRGPGRRVDRSEWNIEMERIEGRWLIRRAQPLMINRTRGVSLRSLLMMMLY